MSLTATQKAKVKELEAISELARVDFWNVEKSTSTNEAKNSNLYLAKDRLVRCYVVSAYVYIDELLCELIVQNFFDPNKTSIELWKTKPFKPFNYHVIESLALMRKLALVKEFKPIPKRIGRTVDLLNMIRNAVTHSFFPMNNRDIKNAMRVTYKGKDIYTVEGLRVLQEDVNEAAACLRGLAKRNPRRRLASRGQRS